MNIKWFLRGYRLTLLITIAVSFGIVTTAFVLLLKYAPHIILYWMNVFSPVSSAIKSAVWAFFPEARWVRTAGDWISFAARWALSKTSAQDEVAGRLYVDGLVQITFWTWVTTIVLRLLSNSGVTRWFNRHFVILRRKIHEEMVKELAALRKPLAPPHTPAPALPQAQADTKREMFKKIDQAAEELKTPKLPPAPQLKIPRDDS